MDSHSQPPHTHDSHAGFSFWHFASMGLGVLFGLSALTLAAGFIYGGMTMSDEKPGAAGTGTSSAASSGGSVSVSSSGTPSMVNGVATILLKPGTLNPMTYDISSFTVKSGQPVKITFSNDSTVPLQHNLCICKPGSKDAMMAEAMKMMTDQNALAKGFIPDTPMILWHTKLINPKGSETLEFTAPAPGDYPYLCTFPGHAALMNGVMKVE